MPTKKQRRRQAKTKRHEYEYVVVDEEGNEVPVDPGELRAQKEKDRPAVQSKGRQQPAARDRRGRVLREPRKPSWQRALKVGLLFIVALFVFTSFVGKSHPSLASRLLLSLAYGVIGVPFFYWMDRTTYRRWERASGRTPQAEPKRKRSESRADD